MITFSWNIETCASIIAFSSEGEKGQYCFSNLYMWLQYLAFISMKSECINVPDCQKILLLLWWPQWRYQTQQWATSLLAEQISCWQEPGLWRKSLKCQENHSVLSKKRLLRCKRFRSHVKLSRDNSILISKNWE